MLCTFRNHDRQPAWEAISFFKHVKRTAILLLSPIEPTEVNKVNSEINFFF